MPTLRTQSNVTVTTGNVQVVQGNMRRVAVIISSPKNNTVWLSFTGPAAIGVGLPLRPGQLPLVLGRDMFGEAITDEIRGTAEAGTELIGVLDIYT